MKNNRLSIEYKDERMTILYDSPLPRPHKEESLRCTSLERATEIVNNRNRQNIKKAIFKNAAGEKIKIKIKKLKN
jgi:hypothetical protein